MSTERVDVSIQYDRTAMDAIDVDDDDDAVVARCYHCRRCCRLRHRSLLSNQATMN
jgi:hypothetical protein